MMALALGRELPTGEGVIEYAPHFASIEVIIAVGTWAARTNRRWVVTTAAVFGAIEFYTQWFERLGAEPWAIIIAGLTIVVFAIALWRYNLTGSRPATVAT